MLEIKKAKCCGTCKHFKETAEFCTIHKIGYETNFDLDVTYMCDNHEWESEDS